MIVSTEFVLSEPAKIPGMPSDPRGGRVVLIEDDECIGRAVSLYLCAKGHRVEVFSRAAPARAWMVRNPCDLVITDIMMPDSDGLEVIQWCRSFLPVVRIIAMSGTDHWGHSHLKAAKLMGASQVVRKPFELSLLAELVAAELAQGQPLPGSVSERSGDVASRVVRRTS